MNKIKFVLGLWLMIAGVMGLSQSCHNRCPKNSIPVQEAMQLVILNKDYWERTNPISFLDTLKKHSGTHVFQVLQGPDSAWFDSTMIPELQIRAKDSSPSAFVYSVYESNSHPGIMRSTVGCQASYLLRSYQFHKYPMTLCSFHGENCK
jgi:hypothetical protein